MRYGLARARAYQAWLGIALVFHELPRPEPFFGPAPHVPDGPCQHRSDWNKKEHPFVCMSCFRSYYDGHPDLWRDPRTDPQPVGKLPPEVEYAIEEDPSLTRRQKREILHRWQEETYGFENGLDDLGVDVRKLIALRNAVLALEPQRLAQIPM